MLRRLFSVGSVGDEIIRTQMDFEIGFNRD